MMDYNAYQEALTPCQIGRIHAQVADEKNAQRKLLVRSWCHRRPVMDWLLTDSVSLNGARDLEGNVTIASGAVLRISDRVSMPNGGKITVQLGGKLILDNCRLHNACGLDWGGIVVEQKGKIHGEVVVIGTVKIENVPSKKSNLKK